MHEHDLKDLYLRLAQRVDRIERHLELDAISLDAPSVELSRAAEGRESGPTEVGGASGAAPRGANVDKPCVPTMLPRVESVSAARGQDAPVAAMAGHERAVAEEHGAGARASGPTEVGGSSTAEVHVVNTPSPSAQTWEITVGTRWLAWAGSAVVLLAVGFFLQVAYEQGWLGLLPDGLKCALAAAFGGVLLATGEAALRKVGRAAAVGLYAAGLGTLYLAAYATFGYYGLVSEQLGFVMLTLVAALGFGLTWRAGMLTIGLLSLIAGYGAPLLMHEAPASVYILPAYLTVLFSVGLGLAAVRPKPFGPLRVVALLCQGLLALAWLTTLTPASAVGGVVFLGIWWTVLSATLIWHAAAGREAVTNAVLSLLATFGLIVGGGWLLADAFTYDRFALGTLTLLVALASAVLALAFTPGIDALRTPTRNALAKLAIAFWGQVGVLLAATIALYCDDVLHTLGWLALALACIEVGRRLPSGGVQWFGLAVGALAGWRVFGVDLWLDGMGSRWLAYGDVQIVYWGLLLLALIGATYFAAWRARVGGLFIPTALTVMANLLWVLWCVSQLRDVTATMALLAVPLAMLLWRKRLRRQFAVAQATWLLPLVALKWLTVDNLRLHFEHAAPLLTSWPVLNERLGVGVLIVAALAWLAVILRKQPPRIERLAMIWRPVMFATTAIALTALTLELRQALLLYGSAATPWPHWQALLLWSTLLWSGGGLLLFGMGRRVGVGELRDYGWGYQALAATVWLTSGVVMARMANPPVQAWPLLNLQALVGVGHVVLLAMSAWTWRRLDGASAYVRVAAVAIGVLVWSLGTVEIDRYFHVADHGGAMAKQAALSVWWSAFATGLICLGFARRATRLRQVGLIMLGCVLAKVLVFDLAEVRYLYRVLSLLATGMLLIGVSVVYNRLVSRLREPAVA